MRTIDDELKELILEGRGSNRNMEEYAKAIGISVAALYRIMNGKIKRSLTDKVLHAIADNAAEGSNVTYERVLNVTEKYLYYKNYSDDMHDHLKTRSNQMYHAVNRLFAESGIPYAGIDVNGSYKNFREEPYFDFAFRVITDNKEERFFFQVANGSLPLDGFCHDIDLFGGHLMHNGIGKPDEWYYLVVSNDRKDIPLSDRKKNIDNLMEACSDYTSFMNEGVLAVTPIGSEEYIVNEFLFNDASKSVILDSENYGHKVTWDDVIDEEIEIK